MCKTRREKKKRKMLLVRKTETLKRPDRKNQIANARDEYENDMPQFFYLSTTSHVIRSESRASIDAEQRRTRDLLG